MKKSLVKKIFGGLLSSVICFGLFAQVALAQYGLSYVTVTGLGTRGLKPLVFAIINVILGFLGIVAIVIILYAGLTWMTAAGNEEKVGKARQMLMAGIVGLAIVLAAWAIAQFVVGSLINATQG